MLVPLSGLFDRTRRQRRDEIRALRRAIARPSGPASADEVALARRLRALRQALAGATGGVSACGGCARGRPAPGGTYAGGHCCSGATADVWTDLEIAAHAVDGTRVRDLAAACEAPAGCGFRGATGCALAAADRPSVCARYVCRELARELHAGGRLDEVERLLAELDATFAAFAAAHAARTADDDWARITAAGSTPRACRRP